MMVKAERMVGDIKITEVHEQAYKDGLAVIKITFTVTHRGYVSPSFTTAREAVAFITNFKEQAA